MKHGPEKPVKMQKIWDIPGGVHLVENKEQSLQLPLADIPLASEFIYPLNQHMGAPAIPLVNVGDKVLAGEKIAEADGIFSAPIHASTSGTIIAIENRPLPHPSGLQGEAIVLASDGEHQWKELQDCEHYRELPHLELVEKIRSAGIVGLGGAGFPTAVKLNPKASYSIHTLILNGTECEPYITADDILMQTRGDEIIAGAEILAIILNKPQNILIGVEDNKPKAIAAIRKAIAAYKPITGVSIRVVSFPTKYPSGGEKQLIKILTGQEVPNGDIPASIGIVVQNVGTAVAVYRAARFGEPLVSRITTLVGDALEVQRNINAPLGTPISHLLEQHGFDRRNNQRLIMGGPMMGFTLATDAVPVIKTTNCIIAPSVQELPAPAAERACIRCGFCEQACPVSLLPQQLYWYARHEDYDRAENYHLFDCIECGACAHVCPSNIPLVQYYRAAKGAIRNNRQEKIKSDLSRQRFEFRKQRLAIAEAEKNTKREARKRAAAAVKKNRPMGAPSAESSQPLPAESAKSMSAEGFQPMSAEGSRPMPAEDSRPVPAEGSRSISAEGSQYSDTITGENDPVAAAITRARAQGQNPQAQQDRLQRAVLRAEDRVEKLTVKLNAATEDRKDKVDAQLHQAKARLNEAVKNLSEHISSQNRVN